MSEKPEEKIGRFLGTLNIMGCEIRVYECPLKELQEVLEEIGKEPQWSTFFPSILRIIIPSDVKKSFKILLLGHELFHAFELIAGWERAPESVAQMMAVFLRDILQTDWLRDWVKERE